MALENKLEAVLFYKGESESIERLAKILQVKVEELDEAANKLSINLSSRGIRLLKVDDQYELVTAPETSEVINNVRKDELVRDLGKAGSETLSIVLYRGPVSRADIDYIRGVNSTFILRNLQIRGLVKCLKNPDNARSYVYVPTTDLLKHLGVTEIRDLPNYEIMRAELDKFESERKKHETDDTDELIEKTNI